MEATISPDFAKNPLSVLTPKQKMFVESYIQDKSGPNAAIKAGYSMRSAYIEAHRLLKNHKIKAALDMLLKEKLLSKETFVEKALNDYEAVPVNSNNRPRFLELAAKGSGILGSGAGDGSAGTVTNNVQINMKVEVNKYSEAEILDKIKSLIG
jgi:hypothetical protein